LPLPFLYYLKSGDFIVPGAIFVITLTIRFRSIFKIKMAISKLNSRELW